MDESQEEVYIRVKTLGRGAFGEAVLYRKSEDNILVVWKEIDLLAMNERSRKDVQTEIEVLSLLSHINICGYFNHFIHEHMLYIELEYANGGSLYHLIVQRNSLFTEEEAIWYFYQIASAMCYTHENGIIHRDIKTLNIFLMKTGVVKIGDFGMAKLLEQEAMAQTVVGTPYYMSPEVVKGQPYNNKSDIWAVGCVFHEILTLKKTFDASNTLALAEQIVTGTVRDIDSSFSPELYDLVIGCLQVDQEKRFSAQDIVNSPPLKARELDVLQKLQLIASEDSTASQSIASTKSMSDDHTRPVVAAASTEVYMWGGGKARPSVVEHFKEGRSALQVAVGGTHAAVLTIEKEVYTWQIFQEGSQAIVGQLGHGDCSSYKQPRLVSYFEKIAIASIACGEDFTTCITDSGNLYTFGSNYFGCLGVGEHIEKLLLPTKVDFFDEKSLVQIKCGSHHVVTLDRNNNVFSWGCNEFGRLGIGNEDDQFVPQKVVLPPKLHIRSIHCGSDGTFFLTASGRVLACGSNEYNKLGLIYTIRGVKDQEINYDIPYNIIPELVKPLRQLFIQKASMGPTHSAVIDDAGRLHTFGSNEYGQLGVGDFKPKKRVCVVKSALAGQKVSSVVCGNGFTIACLQGGSRDSVVYSWGLGENGRLGLDVSVSTRGVACTAVPRPTFGSLYRVSNISCRGWTTLLVAEKILSQTTLRPNTAGTIGFDFLYGTSRHRRSNSPQSPADILVVEAEKSEAAIAEDSITLQNSDATPVWLRAEFNDADYIPLDAEGKVTAAEVPKLPLDQTSQKVEAVELQRKVKTLEERNTTLETQLQEKDALIEALRKQLEQVNNIKA